MGATAENNQYYKGKQTIMDEVSASHKSLLSAVAGRKFLRPPGYLHEAVIGLELIGKSKLSTLNYNIVAEAIQREIVQAGHGYSDAYKKARIVFELSKQALLNDLSMENADLDATHSLAAAEVDRLFVDLDIRKFVLITTKTSIGLEMEGLKQEMIDTGRLTFSNETALINERLITAAAKLAMIPQLEALVLVQERILLTEEANLPLAENLITEKGLLLAKKGEILPHIADKATARLALADKKSELIPQIEEKALLRVDLSDKKGEILSFAERKIDAQVDLEGVKLEILSYIEDRIDSQVLLSETRTSLLPFMTTKSLLRQQLSFKKEELLPVILEKAESIISLANKELGLIVPIAERANEYMALAGATITAIAIEAERFGVAIQKAELKKAKVDGTLDILSAEKAIEGLRQTLSESKRTLQLASMGRQISLIDTKTENDIEMTTGRTSLFDALSEDKATVSASDIDARGVLSEADLSADIDVTDIAVDTEKTSIRRVAALNSEATTETATAAATAKITSELVHLLGGG